MAGLGASEGYGALVRPPRNRCQIPSSAAGVSSAAAPAFARDRGLGFDALASVAASLAFGVLRRGLGASADAPSAAASADSLALARA